MSIYTATRPTPDNPMVPGVKLAQLVRPARGLSDQPHVKAEKLICHNRMDAHEVARACFERWGLMRKGLAIVVKPVTARDLGMVELPA